MANSETTATDLDSYVTAYHRAVVGLKPAAAYTNFLAGFTASADLVAAARAEAGRLKSLDTNSQIFSRDYQSKIRYQTIAAMLEQFDTQGTSNGS